MPVKAIVKEASQSKERPFPKLMRSTKTGAIIIATTGTWATLIFPGTGGGTVGCAWTYESGNFTDFDGEVTLKNDQG
jgi:hypothetical protein